MRKFIKFIAISIALALMILPLYAFTLEGEADFNYSLNGNINVSITSDKNEADFKAELDTWIDGCNMVSGDSDMALLKSIIKTTSGFDIALKFRRIDKVRPQGEFELKSFNEYTSVGSVTREYIEKLNNGNISCTVNAAYDGMLGQITVPRSSVLKVEPYTASGEKISTEVLYNNAAIDKKSDIVTFKVFDVASVEKITIKLPGKIKFYGGQSVKLTSENTVELKPQSVRATVLKNKKIVNSDGVEVIEPSLETKDIGALVGYIVLDRGMSPLAVGLLIATGVIVVGLVIFGFVFIRRKGKEILDSKG